MLKIWSKYEDSFGGGAFFAPLRVQRGLFVKSFKTVKKGAAFFFFRIWFQKKTRGALFYFR